MIRYESEILLVIYVGITLSTMYYFTKSFFTNVDENDDEELF